MSRLIDAERFEKEQFKRCHKSLPYVGTCSYDRSPLWKEIENAPTVDAVEVVRCKDCKHWDKEEYAEGNLRVCDCPIKDWATDDTRHHSFVTLYKPEDYCSYGERKEG